MVAWCYTYWILAALGNGLLIKPAKFILKHPRLSSFVTAIALTFYSVKHAVAFDENTVAYSWLGIVSAIATVYLLVDGMLAHQHKLDLKTGLHRPI